MMRTQTMRAIRDYRDLATRMQGELNQIDAGLRDEVRKEREQVIQEKYQKHLDAFMAKIQAGRQHFESERLKAANPFTALMRKTLQVDDKPGLAAVCDGLALMGPEEQLSFASEIGHPQLALKAITNIRKMDLDPEARMQLDTKVQGLTKGYIDKAAIREHAEVEQQCLEVEALENKISNGDVHKRAAIGYRIEALKRVLASGEVPDSEIQAALAHADPLERMQAARKAG